MKYRKKTVIIEAEQYKPGMEDGFSCIPFVSLCQWKNEDGKYKQCMQCKLDIPKKPFISTPEGNYYINDGDWIITEVDGGRYLCNQNMFEMTYELVEMDTFKQDIESRISYLQESCTPKTQDKVYRLGEQRGLEYALELYREYMS